MREYATPAGFRAAVEATLRERARRLGVPAYIIRRQAALERLIVRLTEVAPDRWALKGGMALETRLGERARVSVDYFTFAVAGSEELREAGVGLAVRYKVESSLVGRPFEPLQVDVSISVPDPWDAQRARRPGLLTALGLGPIEVLLVPLERQVAEKLHAFTRTYTGGGTTRGRDLVDLMLVLENDRVDAKLLRDVIRRVFDRRATHPVPDRLPPPPRELAVSYRREAERVGLPTNLDDVHRLLGAWLDPVLAEVRSR